MNSNKPKRSPKTTLLNTLFVLGSAGLFLFLWMAPEETTAFLPRDDTHKKFYEMKSKKEAEKFCLNCHGDNRDSPLSPQHPPKFRCLFCHKRK